MVEIRISIVLVKKDGEILGEVINKTISLSKELFKELESHMELFKTLADHIQIIKEMKET